jgi:hypothetical protein
MGTNYYVPAAPPCPTCGHGSGDLHIGKSSAGWVFNFRAHTEHGLTSWAAWQAFLEGREIRDEYGDPVTLDELREIVASKVGKWNSKTAPASVWGPYGREGYTFDAEGHQFSEREFC